VQKGTSEVCFTKNKKDLDLALPYIAMGYMMSKHAFLSHFFPYFLLLGNIPFHPLPLLLKWTVDVDSLAIWVRVIAEKVALFRKVMPMAMENLSIAQHRDTLRYAHT